jgi:hypothetical protein
MFIEQRQVGQMAVFSYLVGDEESGEALVIDPADEVEAIVASAKERKVQIKTLIRYTHGLWTPSAATPDMKQASPGPTFIIHEADAPMLTDTPRRPCSGCSYTLGLAHHSGPDVADRDYASPVGPL